MNKRAIFIFTLSALAVSGLPVAGEAASFDCRKAATADEKAICSDASLSGRDEQVAEAYRLAKGAAGTGAIRNLARELLAERRSCRSDAGCIAAVQEKSLRLYGAVSGEPSAVGKLPYGSRAGMQVTVVGKSGIGTARAVILVEHRREDAEAFCREYVGEVTPECVAETLAEEVATSLSGDCSSGEFVTLAGQRLLFLSRTSREKVASGEPELSIIDPQTGGKLDGSMASGYSVAAEQLKALCPGL